MQCTSIKIWDDASNLRLSIACLAEFIGTGLLVFLACGFVFVTSNFEDDDDVGLLHHRFLAQFQAALGQNSTLTNNKTTAPEDVVVTDKLLRNSFAIGAIVSSIVLATNPISGGHINPVVSLAFLLLGKLSLVRLIAYVFAQCLGAITASGLLMGAFSKVPGGGEPFACNYPAPIVSDFQAIIFEAVATFVLVFVILTICNVIELSGKPSNRPPMLLIGSLFVTMTLIIYVAGPFSSASMNPARSFGPAIVWGCWQHHHVYWFGPITGSILASSAFYIFRVAKDEESEENHHTKHFSGNVMDQHEMKPLLNGP